MIGAQDAALIRHFLAHYRALGIASFHLLLHGDWQRVDRVFLEQQDDVVIERVIDTEYSDKTYCQELTNLLHEFKGRWVVHADADEFTELPLPGIARTIAAMKVLGIVDLPALMIQRQAPDGDLPHIRFDESLDRQFPYAHFNLCEEMGVHRPSWKTKFPLFLVTENCRRRRGNHLPPNGLAPFHAPLRAVVHHFKWSGSFIATLNSGRKKNTNQRERDAYHQYLTQSKGKLPLRGAARWTRSDLFARGLLVRPSRRELLLGSLMRQARQAGNPAQARRTGKRLKSLDLPEHDGSRIRPKRARLANLLLQPGRICLVSSGLFGPTTDPGVATAVSALAERLAAAGHEVEVVFCPFAGPSKFPALWSEFWEARGVTVHYLPRRITGDETSMCHRDFMRRLDDTLAELRFDVIHFVDPRGCGGSFCRLQASGLAKRPARTILSVHGPGDWHRPGDGVPWQDDEPFETAGSNNTLELCDLTIFPNDDMRRRIMGRKRVLSDEIVLPGCLPGAGRSFSRTVVEPGRVDEIVVFGGFEHREGVSVFCEAMRALSRSDLGSIAVTFLGKQGENTSRSDVLDQLGARAGSTTFIDNFNSLDAVNYLKTRNCLVVLPSPGDNLSCTLCECLENAIPVMTSSVGGNRELIDRRDHDRVIVADCPVRLANALKEGMRNGFAPARLAFEPTLAEARLLAVHAKLVEEARRQQKAARTKKGSAKPQLSVLIYGSGRPDHEEGVTRNFGSGTQSAPRPEARVLGAQQNWAYRANSQARAIKSGLVLFCEDSVTPLVEDLAQPMMALLKAGRYDAVVCDFRVGVADDRQHVLPNDALSRTFAATPGAPELSPVWNIYGAGIFLMSSKLFVRHDGFNDAVNTSRLAHWEFLNRLEAAGCRIAAVPMPLVAWIFSSPGDYAAAADLQLCEHLTVPWTRTLSTEQAQIVRRTISTLFDHDPYRRCIEDFLNDRQPGPDSKGARRRESFFERLWGSAN